MKCTIFRYKTNHPRRGRVSQAGFTLLLAALVASVVVSLGTAIFQVAQKQILLSGIGRDSQFAFYAADTIAECALFWDFRFGYFALTTPTGVNPTCDGQSIAISPTAADLPYPFTHEPLPINLFIGPDSNGYCAIVTVKKEEIGGAVRTMIHADGYSVSCDQRGTSPRALQRSIELNY